jgi:hypothetical protein
MVDMTANHQTNIFDADPVRFQTVPNCGSQVCFSRSVNHPIAFSARQPLPGDRRSQHTVPYERNRGFMIRITQAKYIQMTSIPVRMSPSPLWLFWIIAESLSGQKFALRRNSYRHPKQLAAVLSLPKPGL